MCASSARRYAIALTPTTISTRHSAYRDYGRFGMFFEKDIPADGKLEVRYRFLILDGDFPGRESVEKAWTEYSK